MNEKETQRLYERISAYIDGESDAPRDIERLIESDAAVARLHAELSRLSTGLKALPAPDVHPAFATRVMAHVREASGDGEAVPAWRTMFVRFLGTVAAIGLVAIAVWPFWPDKGISAPTVNDPLVAEVLRLRSHPDQALAAQFGPLIVEPESDGEWPDTAETDTELALAADPVYGEDYTEVAGRVASLIGGDNGYDEDVDMFATLDSLSEPQAEALRALLTDYVEGGNDLL